MQNTIKSLAIGLFLGVITFSTVDARTLDEFADRWMDNANVTSPQSWQSQSGRRGVSMGGVSARAPVVDWPDPVTLTPPRLDASCGGIDLYAGGFSFINADQIIAQLRAIGQNAQSLVYMMGIKLLSASLEDQISTIQDWASNFNSFQMDSCKAAEGLLAAGSNLIKSGSSCVMERMNTYGEGWDVAQQNCGAGAQLNATESAMGEDVNKYGFVKGNLTWHVLMEDSLYRASPDFAEIMLNVFGTVLATTVDPSVATSGKVWLAMPGIDDPKGEAMASIMKVVTDGGAASPVNAITCIARSSLKTGCDAVERSTKTYTMVGIKTRIHALFDGIVTKIRNDQPFTPEEQAIMSYGELPIYRILMAMSASGYIYDNSDDVAILAEQLSNAIIYYGIANTGQHIRDLAMQLSNGAYRDEEVQAWLVIVKDITNMFRKEGDKLEGDIINREAVNAQAKEYEKGIVERLSPEMFSRVMYGQ